MDKPAFELVHYETARHELAAATIDEAKEIRDRAMAYEAYAKQALDGEMERQAQLIRHRAERRCGELLAEMKAAGQRDSGSGGDRKSQSAHSTVKTLSDLGITKDQSSTWQRLAEVAEDRFEAIVEENTVSIPTATQIVEQVKQEQAREKGERDGSTYEGPTPEALPKEGVSLPSRRYPLTYTVPLDLADRVRVFLRNHNLSFDTFMFNAIRAALAPTFVAPPEVEEAVEDSPASTVDVAAGECAPEPGEFVLVNKTALTVNALPVIKAPAPPEERSEYQVEEDLKTEHVEARVVEPEVAGHAMRTEDDIRRERARTARAFARGRITVGQQKAMQHLFNGQKRLVLDLPKKIARALLELKGAEPKN